MPGMGGTALLEAYRCLPQAQQDATRVGILTPSVASRDLARSQELPTAGLATQPLTRGKITALLRLYLQRRRPAE